MPAIYQFESEHDHFLACSFLKASTVTLPAVKVKNSSQMAVALRGTRGMVSKKQNRNQILIIRVGTLTTIHNSFHV
jgi:hypothetical protein